MRILRRLRRGVSHIDHVGALVSTDEFSAEAGHQKWVLLAAGKSFSLPPIVPSREHVLRVIAAAPGAADICSIKITLNGSTALATMSLAGHAQPTQLDISLAALAGVAHSITVTAELGNSAPVRVTRLQVAASDRLGRGNALSGYEARMRNELQHFSTAYTHAMYGTESTRAGAGSVREANNEVGDACRHFAADQERRARAILAALPPQPGEATFNYASRCLGTLLPVSPPDFLHRADSLSTCRPLRMLSLCSGAARIEEQILRHSRSPIRLTLLDAARPLVQRAADRLAAIDSIHAVDCLVGDINRGLPGDDRYDVILCVSALHHVADLETVLSQSNARLNDCGEFWSVGEQIGRNGNRLWPDALDRANRAFASLPARLRRNAHTGVPDEAVNDVDYSDGCFEGIRSEELETLLERYFVPLHQYKRNAFLWRFVDATYGDNFKLDDPVDLAHLHDLIVAEVTHWSAGGRSTEQHSIYRKKTVRAGPIS